MIGYSSASQPGVPYTQVFIKSKSRYTTEKGYAKGIPLRFELLFNSSKYVCEKIDSPYFTSYFPWQIELTILHSAKPTGKLQNCTFLLS